MNLYSAFKVLSLVVFLFFSGQLSSQTVTPWLTTGDQVQLLQKQSHTSFSISPAKNASTITIDASSTFQLIDGFGFCMTEGSAEVIVSLDTIHQTALMNDLFNPSTGIGVSVVRISIGASDLSSSDYTYQDGDSTTMFNMAGPDLTFLIPVLKKALAINPNLKILATPWTAPLWMKTNNAWVGGTLKPSCYAAYATYFVNYLNAMKAQGIAIWAVTPQNEPENGGNDPSMTFTSIQEATFINNNLGPVLAENGYSSIKIIGFDHNCNNTAYPEYVFANTGSYVDGSAFHLYGGSISALTKVHNFNPIKNVYFTEQYTGSEGSFSDDFGWHIQHVIAGSLNNWAKIVLEWNVANDEKLAPRTPGGCKTCLGAFTIHSRTVYTRNKSYYILAQISKFVKVGATRISSVSTNNAISSTAIKNHDGSIAVLAYNSSGTAIAVSIFHGNLSFDYSIPAKSAVTFVYQING